MGRLVQPLQPSKRQPHSVHGRQANEGQKVVAPLALAHSAAFTRRTGRCGRGGTFHIPKGLVPEASDSMATDLAKREDERIVSKLTQVLSLLDLEGCIRR